MKLALPCTTLLSLILPLAGCRALPEPQCQSVFLVPISQVSGPRRAALNQTVTYKLRYTLGNKCGAFNAFVLNTDTTAARVMVRQVGASGNFVGCSCAADTTSTLATYQFQPQRAGTYYVQFLTTSNGFLTDTLTVQ